ncbi:HdrB C-terminal domain-containing protein [Campylobacter concisus]
MQKIEIFRFNAKKDILSYFKPYFLEILDYANLDELFLHIKKIDPYFQPTTGFVKVNDVVVSTAEPLVNLYEKFVGELVISPLDEKRAVLDLEINDDDFWEKFKPFDKFCDQADKEFYASLKPYFYADFVREYEPNFIGAAAIILAHHLYKKEKNDEIMRLINNENGILIACKIDDFIFGGSEIYTEAIRFFKEILGIKEDETAKNELKNIKSLDKFKEFKIAVSDKIPVNLDKFRANFINLNIKIPCGFELLKVNEKLAFALASKTIFNAFDSGADFLLASNEAEFYMFDTLSKKLEKFTNRSLQDFYILRVSELIELENGKIPGSLKEHTLKVNLV